MDLVEIRKKARQNAAEQKPQVEIEAQAAGTLHTYEEPEEPLVLPEITLPAAEQTARPVLQQYFPDLDLATEEDYIQGISGLDRSVDTETVQWLTFMLGPEEYALSLDVVLELIKPRDYTELPKVPEYVKGILSLRGVVVPVVDMRLRLKLGHSDDNSYQRIIVCEGKEQSIGILVDRITQVVRVANDAIEPAPLVLSEVEKEFVAGVGRFQGRMLILLNPEEILKL